MPMTNADGPGSAGASQWLSMGGASALLGVSTATLRRWADEGEIMTFTTPGGHRRVARAAVNALLSASPPRSIGLTDAATPDRIRRAYRHSLRATASTAKFLEGVPSAAREPLRSNGRAITASILGYLEASTETARDAALAEGLIAAAAYGRIAGALGATMRETVAAFLRFRMPFVHEMAGSARRSGLGAQEAAGVLEAVTVAIDRLLDATLEGYEAASARTGRRTSGPAAARR